jgi:phosphatidate cytidylyltransferase
MAFNFKTFTTRTITAIFFVAVLLSCVSYNFISFASLFFIVSIWGLIEFYQLAEKLSVKPYKIAGIIVGCILFGFGVIVNTNLALFLDLEMFFAIVLMSFFLLFIFSLFDKKPNSSINLTYTVTGLVYAVLPFVILMNISCIDKAFTFNHPEGSVYEHVAPYNFHYVLGILLLIWISDVGAYLVGSFFGKHKLFERISPGKTWEGSIGAVFLTVLGAFIISKWFNELELKHWIVIAILVSVFGTIGDLIESSLKRQAGVKDSGRIMPGHGGILDRFDSLIFVSPIIYFYLTMIH